MKGFTDMEQSKVLAGILPIESADMSGFRNQDGTFNYYGFPYSDAVKDSTSFPVWSLVALFKSLPKGSVIEKGVVTELSRVTCTYELVGSDWRHEPIDACVEAIVGLHEKRILQTKGTRI